MEEKRDKKILIKFTQKELDLIKRNMDNIKVQNRSGFIRKMAIDGYFITLEVPELKEVSRLLNITSNNVNQIAKLGNSTGSVYQNDIFDLKTNINEIKLQFGEILTHLSKIGG